MGKKIFLGLFILLTLGFIILIQYQVFDYNSYLKKINADKMKIENDIVNIKNDVNKINDDIDNIDKQTKDFENQIQTTQTKLTDTNNKIADKIKEINNNHNQNISGKVAYLTIDDGPSNNTDRILDILKNTGVKATFFVNGREDSNSIRLYKRIVNEGHSIGNHTYSHSYQINYSSVSSFDNNFNRLETLIKNTTGVTMTIMRFPGGSNNTISNSYNNGIMNVLTARYKDLGYAYFDWNVTAADTASVGVTNASVINNIVNGCKSRSKVIILMHDTQINTPNTLETIIQNLSSMGFKFLPLTSTSYTVRFK